MTRVEPEPGYFESLARLKKKRSRGWENSIKNKVPSPPKEDRKLKDEGLGRENKNVGGGKSVYFIPIAMP
jgi:hypothetical protein